MKVQVVYKPRHFSYDKDWLDAFEKYAQAELISSPSKLDADLIVILHSVNAQWAGYPEWLVKACQDRRGKLVIFHTNEFKDIEAREKSAKSMGVDYIVTQLTDGRLYSVPTISLPHALNPEVFKNYGIKRKITVGFRGARYKPGIHDERNSVIEAFSKVPGSDIVLDKHTLLARDEWAGFLNNCLSIPGAEAGNIGARIISPRHLDAIGCGTLQILLKGNYCGVIDERHYLPFTTVKEAMDVVLDDKKRNEITERAYVHVLENHTYRHRIEKLLSNV